MIRGRRFADVIDRQLALFENDHAELIAACAAAERTYDRADRDEAEERYGDFLDLAAAGSEILVGLRDGFAATLDEAVAEEYEASFNRAVVRRFPRFGVELDG